MPRTHGQFYYIPQIIALLIVAPLAWWAFDRQPPLTLVEGKVIPYTVERGQANVTVTWRARFSGRDCPGFTQRELVDSQKNLWPKLLRERRGVFHEQKARSGIVTTPPLAIPLQMAPGRATHRVTNIYYCNWLQRLLRWPIVSPSPYIPFNVAP